MSKRNYVTFKHFKSCTTFISKLDQEYINHYVSNIKLLLTRSIIIKTKITKYKKYTS